MIPDGDRYVFFFFLTYLAYPRPTDRAYLFSPMRLTCMSQRREGEGKGPFVEKQKPSIPQHKAGSPSGNASSYFGRPKVPEEEALAVG